MAKLVQAIAAGLLATCIGQAHADDRPACERFDWPLAIERSWFEAADLPPVETGATLSAMPAKGVSLKLKPAAEVKLAAAASRPTKLESPKSGIVTFEASAAGLYQVTISADGWLDVVQGGVLVAAESHTGNRECAGLRKSVRFKLTPGPVSIQVTGASVDTIAAGVRRVE
jgi:hypothetical protein